MPLEVTLQLGKNIYNRATEKSMELEDWRKKEKASRA
jgi:hypothetical protein